MTTGGTRLMKIKQHLQHLRIPLDVVTRPRDGECRTDRWWVVDEDENIILYKGVSPQCSRHRSLVEGLANDLWGGASVRRIPAVYLGPVDEDGYYTNPYPQASDS